MSKQITAGLDDCYSARAVPTYQQTQSTYTRGESVDSPYNVSDKNYNDIVDVYP